MSEQFWLMSQMTALFGADATREAIIHAEKVGRLPKASREQRGKISRRVWRHEDLPLIGEAIGFLKKPSAPLCAVTYSSKGGTFKTSLTLNIARMAALHNIKVCVVGLDFQCDITNAFDLINYEEANSLAELEELDPKGLLDVFNGDASLSDVIMTTDLPNLKIIPESPELTRLERELIMQTGGERWLQRNVVTPLKGEFDLILMDCSPSWSRVVEAAIASADVLIAPLETSIMHYRNLETFLGALENFEALINQHPARIFVPTRFNRQRKLSKQILEYYRSESPAAGVTQLGLIRDAVVGEEAITKGLSIPEYKPRHDAAREMRDLLTEIFDTFNEIATQKAAKTEAA